MTGALLWLAGRTWLPFRIRGYALWAAWRLDTRHQGI